MAAEPAEVRAAITKGDKFFSPWEGEPIGSWSDAQEAIERIVDLATERRALVWRGQADASWSLHSSLYRKLAKGAAAPPLEDRLVKAEKALLRYCRQRWRFDQMSALEIMAHLQHYGALTRLIDVTFRPHVALWFAVAEDASAVVNKSDGRLFIFDASSHEDIRNRRINLGSKYAAYDLPWADDGTSAEWCYELPLVWTPPSYNDRIPAQAAAFILAGVPKFGAGRNSQYRRSPGAASSAPWKVADVRAATSVPVRMVAQDRALQNRSHPTFTLRITASAKPEIRKRLERDYGFNAATMYPDLFGMATTVRAEIDRSRIIG